MIRSCRALLEDFRQKSPVIKGKKLSFSGVEGEDVYNISKAFADEGRTVIAGRVERRGSEVSRVCFFERTGETEYALLADAPQLAQVQDPFVTTLGEELVVGGTHIDLDPLDPERIINWRTIFFKGPSVRKLAFWGTGPDRMKDVRLLSLGGKILFFTRPQGKKGGLGRIGRTVLPAGWIDADELREAPVFDTFLPDEWGGANDLHLLKNGKVGVLGHISFKDEAGLHYHAMAFCYDPASDSCTLPRIICTRGDLPAGPAKRPDLADVLFSGGLVRLGGGRAELYCGGGDCEGFRALLEDPFEEYEDQP